MTAPHEKRVRREARAMLFAARDIFEHPTLETHACRRALLGAARGERGAMQHLPRYDAFRDGANAMSAAIATVLDAARVECSRAEIVVARERAVEILRTGGA